MDVEDIRFHEKLMKVNYYFSFRHVRKKPSVSTSSQYILWFEVIILLICALLGNGFLGFWENRHLSVKEFCSRSDRRLTQIYAPS